MKKIKQTNDIFANVFRALEYAQTHERVLNVSIDSKAKVKVGNLSRVGKDRRKEAPKAHDHDTQWEAKLVPFGILDLNTDDLCLYFGESAETSDFIVDSLEQWWFQSRYHRQHWDILNIYLDGGSATRYNRTQFKKRIIAWAKAIGIRIRLVYYPPYHSKYNKIERCWAALENFWNGAILDSVETVLGWAKNMTWKGMKPQVFHNQNTYPKGIKATPEELSLLEYQWRPSIKLPKWDITILHE